MLKRIVKNERVSGLHEIVVHISLSPDEFQECGQISVNLNLLLHEGGEPLLREDAESVRGGLISRSGGSISTALWMRVGCLPIPLSPSGFITTTTVRRKF